MDFQTVRGISMDPNTELRTEGDTGDHRWTEHWSGLQLCSLPGVGSGVQGFPSLVITTLASFIADDLTQDVGELQRVSG